MAALVILPVRVQRIVWRGHDETREAGGLRSQKDDPDEP